MTTTMVHHDPGKKYTDITVSDGTLYKPTDSGEISVADHHVEDLRRGGFKIKGEATPEGHPAAEKPPTPDTSK